MSNLLFFLLPLCGRRIGDRDRDRDRLPRSRSSAGGSSGASGAAGGGGEGALLKNHPKTITETVKYWNVTKNLWQSFRTFERYLLERRILPAILGWLLMETVKYLNVTKNLCNLLESSSDIFWTNGILKIKEHSRLITLLPELETPNTQTSISDRL